MAEKIVDYKPDRDMWNIAKGIGIIGIILGHCLEDPVANYLYMFHLQFFFFISGYLYSENKYGDEPWLNVLSRLKRLWVPYFIIITVFVLLHNLFLTLGLQLEGTDHYSLGQIVEKICYAMFGYADEFLAGPVWFLRTLAVAMIIFGFIIYASRKLERRFHVVSKIIFQVVVTAALTVVGYIFIQSHIQLPCDMQISFTVLPFIYCGYVLRNYVGDITRYLNPFAAIISFVIVGVVSVYKDVDMTTGNVFPYMHLIALLGIYGCLYLSKLASKWKVSSQIMSFVGEISLYIMAIHFFVIRGIDRISVLLFGHNAYELMSNAFMWVVYALVICVVSVGISYGIKKLVDVIKGRQN